MKIIENNDDDKKKRKRVNKNRKKSWRKYIDISDIDQFQEDQRRDERLLGVLGGPIENKPSEEIFSLDSGSNDQKEKSRRRTRKKLDKSDTKSKSLNHRQDGLKPSNRLTSTKNLKCHQFITGLPGVKAISKKKGIIKQRPCRLINSAMKLSKNTQSATKRRLHATKQRRKAIKENKSIETSVEFKEDLWNYNDKEIEKFGEVGKTYMGKAMEYIKFKTNNMKVSIPVVRQQKTSALSAVVIPKPGASYNPSYDDHQKLLGEAVDKENKRLKKDEKEQRMLKKYAPSKKGGIPYDKWLQEMAEGLPTGQDDYHLQTDFNHDSESEEEEKQLISSKKIQGKKSKQARKKARTVRIKEQLRLKKKEMKQLESKVFRVKLYRKEIEEEIKQDIEKKKRVNKKKKERKFETKRLSRNKFEEEDISVQFGTELAGSLRKIEPMGNPLEDRYKHLQRRNILDPRVKIKRPKAKLKTIKKKDVKRDMKQFVDSLLE